MYIYLHSYIHRPCTDTHTSCAHAHVDVHTSPCDVYKYVLSHTCRNTPCRVHTHVSTYKHIHTHTHTYTHIHTRTHTHATPSQIEGHIYCRMNESCHTFKLVTCEWVVSHTWVRHERMSHTWKHVLHTATHCNTVQHTTIHCNTLQHTATHCYTLQQWNQCHT